jgi:hypothetical protein
MNTSGVGNEVGILQILDVGETAFTLTNTTERRSGANLTPSRKGT